MFNTTDFMGEKTNISWCDATFNAWIGCSKVSPGCANCYAEELDTRRFSKTLGGTKANPVSHWGKGAPRYRTSAKMWKEPLTWNRKSAEQEAARCRDGEAAIDDERHRPRVFCASLSDWLDDEVPIEWLADLLKLIHDTPNLDWLLLTKRPENWRDRLANAMGHLDKDIPQATEEQETALLSAAMLGDMEKFSAVAEPLKRKPEALMAGEWIGGKAPKNVWLGTSIENQAMADKRIPALAGIPANVRFLSMEPLLEEVDISHPIANASPGIITPIHWTILGGESGNDARPCDWRWIQSGLKQCWRLGIRPFVKQLGATCVGGNEAFFSIKDKKGAEMSEWPEALRVREFPEV